MKIVLTFLPADLDRPSAEGPGCRKKEVEEEGEEVEEEDSRARGGLLTKVLIKRVFY